VAVVLLTEQGLWLGRRRSGGWCIPCGHVEWDETIAQAAVREAREEMGLEVDLKEVFAVHSNFHNPHQHTVGIWFLGQASSLDQARPGGDLEELRPFTLDGLPDLIFPTDRLVVEKLRSTEIKNLRGD
jgi:ADP-ribose pyrophosphatase YjhB (NUDIX family)